MEATLEVVSRNRFGRNEAGRIRREGLIPAVVYGEASEGVAGLGRSRRRS
jgi:ribosomal protein L25 (general stress protein Ctc)